MLQTHDAPPIGFTESPALWQTYLTRWMAVAIAAGGAFYVIHEVAFYLISLFHPPRNWCEGEIPEFAMIWMFIAIIQMSVVARALGLRFFWSVIIALGWLTYLNGTFMQNPLQGALMCSVWAVVYAGACCARPSKFFTTSA